MHEVCAACRNSNTCQIQEPVVAKWQMEPDRPIECAYFSCGEGLQAARKAAKSGSFEPIFLADGTQLEAAIFETPEKETKHHFPRRCATAQGIILGETVNGFKPTGQTVYIRTE